MKILQPKARPYFLLPFIIANKLDKKIPIPIPHINSVTIWIALMHSLLFNLTKLKNEIATIKNEIAIARSCAL
jgi:hypothetical protein